MTGRRSLRNPCGVWCSAVAFAAGVFLGGTIGAQDAFVDYDFETGGLEDFFLPIGVDFCGTALPTGTAELAGGEMVISTDDAFGIGMAMLLPEVVEEKFPAARDSVVRLRFSFDEAGAGGQVTQFGLGLRSRVGVDQDSLLIHSELERAYYVSIVPEFVDSALTYGFIAISEFTACHEDVAHSEWPVGDGFAAAAPGFPIIPTESYWLEATTIGDDDGGPVEISAKLWLDGEEPPETPQLTVVDADGLPHNDATRGPETDTGFSFGLNFDLEPRPIGASVRVDDITVTRPGGQEPEVDEVRFRRGDANDDGTVNIADGVFVLNFLFTDIVTDVPCPESSDANDDGGINISDGLSILNYLFVGSGAPPPAPGPETCGGNPSREEDLSGCTYSSC